MLGFFVKGAFNRYNTAGGIWGDELRSSCHALAAKWSSFVPRGLWHPGDHHRVMRHIAAIPLALKAELRGSRDLRELKGLLSERDLGRLQVSPKMIMYCLDVIRSYFFAATCRREFLEQPDDVQIETWNDIRFEFIEWEIFNLEGLVNKGIFLASFRVSSAFIALLRTMLWIWFALLPFALAELEGRFYRS